MHPEIEFLRAKLLDMASRQGDPKDAGALNHAAIILSAIFDPENQPSQFGTVLWKDGDPLPERLR